MDTDERVPPASTDQLAADLSAARTKIANLEIALTTGRTIGIAMGILAERHKITPDAAFQALIGVSQRTHRKVRDIATELIFTGQLPE